MKRLVRHRGVTSIESRRRTSEKVRRRDNISCRHEADALNLGYRIALAIGKHSSRPKIFVRLIQLPETDATGPSRSTMRLLKCRPTVQEIAGFSHPSSLS
jgi:hypothetical protein